jgi:tagatose-6-phosphate ketose/aldose isomerase
MLPGSAVSEWLNTLSNGNGSFSVLLNEAARDSNTGFHHTIREICQQPATWPETARRMKQVSDLVKENLTDCCRVILTGSGSSQYAGECVAPALRKDLGKTIEVFGAGELFLRASAPVAEDPTLVVSLARSGESPESIAVVQTLLETEPRTRHLILTCNSAGRLAREFGSDPRVRVVPLAEDVHDRSLVMTSSFTNLALSARFLGWPDRAGEFVALAESLASAGRHLLSSWPDALCGFVSGPIERIVFLGSGGRYGAAREASLKLLEMTAGKVATMAETYLGLRHGPMCFINERTLLVCFLSSDSLMRAYERDLIQELDSKGLGARKLLAGIENPGFGLCRGADLAIQYEIPPRKAEDDILCLLDVMIGQILGFYRCRQEGLRPDSPSENGIISRVVADFRMHVAEGATQ